MADVLTIDEIKSKCQSEWALIGDPEVDETLEVKAGVLLYHSKDQDAVHKKAREIKRSRIAVLFFGEFPKDSAILL